jgi:hypothetical protein
MIWAPVLAIGDSAGPAADDGRVCMDLFLS